MATHMIHSIVSPPKARAIQYNALFLSNIATISKITTAALKTKSRMLAEVVYTMVCHTPIMITNTPKAIATQYRAFLSVSTPTIAEKTARDKRTRSKQAEKTEGKGNGAITKPSKTNDNGANVNDQ